MMQWRLMVIDVIYMTMTMVAHIALSEWKRVKNLWEVMEFLKNPIKSLRDDKDRH